MSLVALLLAAGLSAALAAIVLAPVLSRAVLAGATAMTLFSLASLAAGGGVVALCFAVVALVWLAILQLFGWMLVDVDHDHLPRLAARTVLARVAALACLACGFAWCVRVALRTGQLEPVRAIGGDAPGFDPVSLGAHFIGRGSDLALLLGLLLAAGLLAALGLLRDEGSEAG